MHGRHSKVGFLRNYGFSVKINLTVTSFLSIFFDVAHVFDANKMLVYCFSINRVDK